MPTGSVTLAVFQATPVPGAPAPQPQSSTLGSQTSAVTPPPARILRREALAVFSLRLTART